MEALLISTLSVASAEVGDKTQLLALVLATRFHKPAPIILGIFVATLISHTMAGAVGALVGSYLQGSVLHLLLAGSFIAAAIWMLIPDKLDIHKKENIHQSSIFVTTIVAFLLQK